MNIKEMHYDFKQKLNKIDSQQYRNLKIPEIDWKLNEAQELFVKVIAEPRLKNMLGFEINQRIIDDIRTIVVNQSLSNEDCIEATQYDDKSYFVALPQDYLFYVSSNVIATKCDCAQIPIRATLRQHDDEHEESKFDSSSFEWREVNIRFFNDGIRIFTDGSFIIENLCLNYLRKTAYIHNAEDFVGGSYDLPGGVSLSGSQNCELPEPTHREIVDLAVLITTGDLQIPDYQVKQAKVKLNN